MTDDINFTLNQKKEKTKELKGLNNIKKIKTIIH